MKLQEKYFDYQIICRIAHNIIDRITVITNLTRSNVQVTQAASLTLGTV
jgi:hypothetical protein